MQASTCWHVQVLFVFCLDVWVILGWLESFKIRETGLRWPAVGMFDLVVSIQGILVGLINNGLGWVDGAQESKIFDWLFNYGCTICLIWTVVV